MVLTCAGFDPSAGAGLLADLRAVDAMGCYGLGVLTCNTVQNDREFFGVSSAANFALEQIRALARRFEISFVKVGLVADFDELICLLSLLRDLFPDVHIVWDPILRASAGFDFDHRPERLDEILGLVDLWTPNLDEISRFYSGAKNAAELASSQADLYLKGGHGFGDSSRDEYWSKGIMLHALEQPRLIDGGKHGSGCHLSALLSASFAVGGDLEIVLWRARRALQGFLSSTNTLLGYYP